MRNSIFLKSLLLALILILHSLHAESNVDLNQLAQTVATTAVSYIPGVGGALSALMGLFWPFGQADIWTQIKEQVEATANRIFDKKMTILRESLFGF